MSDDLRKLMEAVEAGEGNKNDGSLYRLFGDNWVHAWDVIDRGSVDAAIALCEALLPGWVATVDTTGFAHVYKDEFEVTHNTSALLSRQPARALLLAVLRAKLMEMEDET